MEPQPAPSQPLASLSDGLLRTVEGTVVEAGPVRAESQQNADEPVTEGPMQRIDLRLASIEAVTDAEDVQAPVQGNVQAYGSLARPG